MSPRTPILVAGLALALAALAPGLASANASLLPRSIVITGQIGYGKWPTYSWPPDMHCGLEHNGFSKSTFYGTYSFYTKVQCHGSPPCRPPAVQGAADADGALWVVSTCTGSFDQAYADCRIDPETGTCVDISDDTSIPSPDMGYECFTSMTFPLTAVGTWSAHCWLTI